MLLFERASTDGNRESFAPFYEPNGRDVCHDARKSQPTPQGISHSLTFEVKLQQEVDDGQSLHIKEHKHSWHQHFLRQL